MSAQFSRRKFLVSPFSRTAFPFRALPKFPGLASKSRPAQRTLAARASMRRTPQGEGRNREGAGMGKTTSATKTKRQSLPHFPQTFPTFRKVFLSEGVSDVSLFLRITKSGKRRRIYIFRSLRSLPPSPNSGTRPSLAVYWASR